MKYAERKMKFGEVPQGLPPIGEFWVIEEDGKVTAVTFLCPCGCGHETYTPVTDATKGEAKTERHWLYSAGPTLTPSIGFTSGCKAHFNITNGEAVMHGDSGK